MWIVIIVILLVALLASVFALGHIHGAELQKQAENEARAKQQGALAAVEQKTEQSVAEQKAQHAQQAQQELDEFDEAAAQDLVKGAK